MGARVSRRDFLVTTGVGVAGLAAGRRAAAQDKKTLVVAWDSDIDNLDPAVFKSQGGYVTVANTTDAPLMWKVQPLEASPASSAPSRRSGRDIWPSRGRWRTTEPPSCSRSAAG